MKILKYSDWQGDDTGLFIYLEFRFGKLIGLSWFTQDNKKYLNIFFKKDLYCFDNTGLKKFKGVIQ